MRFILVFMIAFGVMSASFAAAETRRLIHVSGEGAVEVAPDMALISLGVTSQADTAAVAMRETSEKMRAVIDSLIAMGIAEKDIQTNQLSIHPRYDHSRNNQAPQITGYFASNVVAIRARDLDALGGLLDQLLDDGANQFQGVQFAMQDDHELRNEARRAAVADAIAKAELYAMVAGVKLGDLVSLTENGGHAPQPMMRGGPVMMHEADSMPIAAGELSIREHVILVYEIVTP